MKVTVVAAQRHERVVEGVVGGAQVGVDLVGEAAGQEAEVLAGLDGGAGEGDA